MAKGERGGPNLILRCLSEALEKNGASELVPKLTNYILFRVMLGM